MTTLRWDASLEERLPDITVVGGLDAPHALAAIDRIRMYGFAVVESRASGLGSDDIAQRSTELLTFGQGLGVPLVQSPRRELVEDVKDYSDREDPDVRGYRSGGELVAHSDPPTLVALHCLQPARVGGETHIVNVAAIVDRMEKQSPGLVNELFEPLPDFRVAGQHGIADEGPAEPHPILALHGGVLSCVLYRPYVEKGAEATRVPLTERQIEALDLFEKCSMAEELTLRFVLRPGQTVVVHNRTVLHARTDFADWPEFDRRRHLLRLWIDAPDTFPVHPAHQLGDFFASRG